MVRGTRSATAPVEEPVGVEAAGEGEAVKLVRLGRKLVWERVGRRGERMLKLLFFLFNG